MLQTDTSVFKLDTNLIIPNKYQPRKVFDEKDLNALAESIKNYGIINPILVRKKDDKYEIIAGERRYRAAKLIGLTEVPVIIKNADEQQMAELALIENLERKNLSPIEEAKSYEEIMRIGNQTQESLAKKLGKSQSSIANKIRLLALPIEIQDALINQKIGERHARSLINVKEKDKQIKLLDRIINEKLTVKETERIINEKEISEQEIKQAIDDIMKSLQMIDNPLEENNEEEKEEKEDDNMNNGNFFPNFDNNNGMNNNASLNMMNMQSMNQPIMENPAEMVMPTMNQQIMPEPMMMAAQQPMDMPQMMSSPEPMPTMENNNPIPDFSQFGVDSLQNQNFNMNFGMNQMQPEPMAPIMENNNPIPDFNQFATSQMNMQQPMDMPQMMMTSEPMVPQMQDTPLFNPDVVMPSPEINPMMNIGNMEYEVPNTPQMDIPSQPEYNEPSGDRFAELQNYLLSNGYNFKAYTGETNNCIIIEL